MKLMRILCLPLLLASVAQAGELRLQSGNLPDPAYVQNATSIWSQYAHSDDRKEGDLYIGNNEPGHTMRALMDFDLSALPEGAEIADLELQFQQQVDKKSVEKEVVVEIWQLGHAVREDGASWDDPDGDGEKGDAGGKATKLLQSVTVNTKKSGNLEIEGSESFVAAANKALKGDGKLNLMLRLQDEEHDARCLVRFRGDEYNAAVSRPLLILRY